MSRSIRALLVSLGIVVTLAGVIRIVRMMPDRVNRNDFAHYYTSSRLLLEGENPYSADFLAERERLGFELEELRHTQGATNPPPLLAFFAPFAALPLRWGFWAWNALQAICLFALFQLSWRLSGSVLPPAARWLLVGAILLSNSVYFHFHFSQTQLLLALLLVGAFRYSLREQHGRALTLALAAGLLKLFPLALLPWIAWRARHRARAWLGPIVFTVAVVGATTRLWPDFVRFGLSIVREHAAGEVFTYSIPSLALNLGAGDVTSTASGLMTVLIAYLLCTRARAPETQYSILLCAAVLASPVAWGHYFVLLIFPFLLYVERAIRGGRRVAIASVLPLYVLVPHVWGGSPYDPETIAMNYIPLLGVLLLAVALVVSEGPTLRHVPLARGVSGSVGSQRRMGASVDG